LTSYTWYFIFDPNVDFPATLVSRLFTLPLNGIGRVEILATRGNLMGITYDDVFLPINLNDKSPFEFEGYAVFSDERGVWLGIEVE